MTGEGFPPFGATGWPIITLRRTISYPRACATGCGVIGGLGLLRSRSRSAKAAETRPAPETMYDRILAALPRRHDGLWAHQGEASSATLATTTSVTCAVTGHRLLIPPPAGRTYPPQHHEAAVREYAWEGESIDRCADSIEGAVLNRARGRGFPWSGPRNKEQSRRTVLAKARRTLGHHETAINEVAFGAVHCLHPGVIAGPGSRDSARRRPTAAALRLSCARRRPTAACSVRSAPCRVYRLQNDWPTRTPSPGGSREPEHRYVVTRGIRARNRSRAASCIAPGRHRTRRAVRLTVARPLTRPRKGGIVFR